MTSDASNAEAVETIGTRIADGFVVAAPIMAFVFAISAAFFLALPAEAQVSRGDSDRVYDIYVEYSGGVAHIRNQRITGADPTGANLSGRIESKTGFHVGGAIGMRFHEHFRGEVQLGYRRAEVDGLESQNEPSRGEGFISLLSVMANGYVDYDLGIGIIPYVGAGVGWGRLEVDAKNEGGFLRMEGEDSVFTWALMIGGSIPVSDSVDISLGYRYVSTTESELNAGVTSTTETEIVPGVVGMQPVKSAERFDSEFDSHEGIFAVRYKF